MIPINLPKEELINSLRRNNIIFAAIFGSRVKGLAKADSDYDFLVEFNPTAKSTLYDIVEVKDGLEQILRSRVDVITTGGLNHRLKDEILSSMQVLYDERQR
ncbi:MAG TPA: nucleotidyltransferase domain-containing protein [Patescibacteria group bacterium]